VRKTEWTTCRLSGPSLARYAPTRAH